MPGGPARRNRWTSRRYANRWSSRHARQSASTRPAPRWSSSRARDRISAATGSPGRTWPSPIATARARGAWRTSSITAAPRAARSIARALGSFSSIACSATKRRSSCSRRKRKPNCCRCCAITRGSRAGMWSRTAWWRIRGRSVTSSPINGCWRRSRARWSRRSPRVRRRKAGYACAPTRRRRCAWVPSSAWGRASRPQSIAFDDHPDAKRFSGRIETVTVDSAFHWLERSGLGAPAVRVR